MFAAILKSNKDFLHEITELDTNCEVVNKNQSVQDNLKDLEPEMVKMFKLAQKTNKSQIKGEKQLM